MNCNPSVTLMLTMLTWLLEAKLLSGNIWKIPVGCVWRIAQFKQLKVTSTLYLILATPVDNTDMTINWFFFFSCSLTYLWQDIYRRQLDMRKNTALLKNVIVLGYLSLICSSDMTASNYPRLVQLSFSEGTDLWLLHHHSDKSSVFISHLYFYFSKAHEHIFVLDRHQHSRPQGTSGASQQKSFSAST